MPRVRHSRPQWLCRRCLEVSRPILEPCLTRLSLAPTAFTCRRQHRHQRHRRSLDRSWERQARRLAPSLASASPVQLERKWDQRLCRLSRRRRSLHLAPRLYRVPLERNRDYHLDASQRFSSRGKRGLVSMCQVQFRQHQKNSVPAWDGIVTRMIHLRMRSRPSRRPYRLLQRDLSRLVLSGLSVQVIR